MFWGLSMVSVGEYRRMELRTDSAVDPLAWVQPARDELLVLPALALYQLRQNETLSRPARITRRTLDPRGQNKDGIEVVLEAGGTANRPYLGKKGTPIPPALFTPFPPATPDTRPPHSLLDRHH